MISTNESIGLQRPVTLRYRISPVRTRGNRAVMVLAIAWLAVGIIGFIWLLAPEVSGAQGDKYLAALVQELSEHPEQPVYWAGIAIFLLLFAAAWKSQQSARMTLGPDGIECRMPRWMGLSTMRQTAGNWRLGWHELTGARLVVNESRLLKPAQRLGHARLVLHRGDESWWVSPFFWFDPADDHRLTLKEALLPRGLDVESRLRESPVVRALEQRGIAIERGDPRARPETGAFDLGAHRGLVALLGIFAVAAGYAVLDAFFIGRFRPLEPMPLWPFAAVAMAALPLVLLLGSGAPGKERSAVSALTIAALVAAVWPGTLRYNAWTGTPEAVVYRATDVPGVFSGPRGMPPTLDLRGEGLDEYWSELPAGAEHEFTLVRGALGIWQLDPAPLYRRTREFYRSR